MNTYFIRCLPADWPLLLSIGQKLGAIAVDGDNVTATQGGAWDFIGTIHKPTGQTDAEGNDLTAPATNAQGVAYLHANLVTPLHLGDVARQLAAEHPEVAQGLAEMGCFFLLDENGGAAAPVQPHRVFAGM